MVNIQPVSVWKDGQGFQASVLNAVITNDDMKSFARFHYELKTEDSQDEQGNIVNGKVLAEGDISMSSDDYAIWDNSNDSAYEYIADKLNLTIITP
jgi:hypothetical protein